MDADPTNMDVPTCPGCVASGKRIAELEARIGALEQKLEASLRSGKRQAAPFSRGLPKVGGN
jgi:transposase